MLQRPWPLTGLLQSTFVILTMDDTITTQATFHRGLIYLTLTWHNVSEYSFTMSWVFGVTQRLPKIRTQVERALCLFQLGQASISKDLALG